MSTSLSITNASPAKIRENIFIAYLTEEVKDFPRISMSELIKLGYSTTTRKLLVNGGYHSHFISELIDSDNKLIVDFCFFWSGRIKEGFIIIKPFDFFVLKKVEIRDSINNN